MISSAIAVAVAALTGAALHPLFAIASPTTFLHKRAGNVTFLDPTANNGSFLTHVSNITGEPLNVIISGTSSSEVLTDTGFLQFARATGFSTECFPHRGDPQSANLGDGNGPQNQTIELREDFANVAFGTCIETIIGGNHLRVYRQNGTLANSGALFLALGSERGLLENHTIALDGYNRGRDVFVAGAVGIKSFNGSTFNTTAQNLTGVMPAGSNGLNHGIAVDGNAVLLTVTIM